MFQLNLELIAAQFGLCHLWAWVALFIIVSFPAVVFLRRLLLCCKLFMHILLLLLLTHQFPVDSVVLSVADLGCLSQIPDPNFSIPDPGSKRFRIPDPHRIKAVSKLSEK